MALKKLAVAAAVSAAMGMGVVGNAQADALAQAELNVSNFALGTYVGGVFTAFSNTQFASLTIFDNASNTAGLNGGFTAQGASSFTLGATVDALQACQGACGAENNFALVTAPPASVFARSDSVLFGTPITVVPNSIPPGFSNPGAAAGATAITLAETSLRGTSFGNSGSIINLTSTLSFVLAGGDVSNAAIRFDATQMLRAWTSPGSSVGTQAGANTGWNISLSDHLGNVILQWNPNGNVGGGTHTGLTEIQDGCNLAANVSASANQPDTLQTCRGTFLAVATGALIAGEQYSFNINHSSQSNATSVPEPGSLALLGLGLLGLGFAGLRKKST